MARSDSKVAMKDGDTMPKVRAALTPQRNWRKPAGHLKSSVRSAVKKEMAVFLSIIAMAAIFGMSALARKGCPIPALQDKLSTLRRFFVATQAKCDASHPR